MPDGSRLPGWENKNRWSSYKRAARAKKGRAQVRVMGRHESLSRWERTTEKGEAEISWTSLDEVVQTTHGRGNGQGVGRGILC